MLFYTTKFAGVLILTYQFFARKVAEIRLEISNYCKHIIGLRVRFLRIRFWKNGMQQLNGKEVSVGRWLLYL